MADILRRKVGFADDAAKVDNFYLNYCNLIGTKLVSNHCLLITDH